MLDRLGLLPAALQCLVPQAGAAWIDAGERRLAEMPVTAFDGRGYVSTEELLRTDLARIVHRAAGPGVTHRFGETVEALEDTPGGVLARFRSGDAEEFDLVVGADGAHSRVRALRFGPEERYRKPLGLAHAWFTLAERPGTPALDGWFLIHNAPGRRSVEARPGRAGEQEVGLTFAADTLPPRHDREARLALLDRTFADVGWRAAEFLAAARQAEDFALDTFDQIRMPSWRDGRVVLLGDSAWCASPLSGLGTALALRGAAELAAALDAADVLADPGRLPAALAAFEQAMRPRVASAQQLPPGRVASVAPRTALGIRANALAMRALQSRALRPLVRRAMAGTEHGRTAAQPTTVATTAG
ncbi:FAD-dependent monooxygenase [Streptomyces sp. TLI_171]|uniref:FAD-dependent monooxygenase n=1 Tax=Streptomyces sp. TLI_171 TaxID=1938859 RepID=UPI000C178ADD|nr:FAD-dependent monooxygenase [Streptomyces sp. TLI_171]RKE16873.1 2-polyprenyl-6-methoxyphenol hydroxylase-like FAD-dependent oxidoreductase [Streptomyces sp. TLI_171]